MAMTSGPPRAAVAASQPGPSPETILRWAARSLYQDEAIPRGSLLQWLLLYLLGVNLSPKQLRALIADTPGLRLSETASTDFHIVGTSTLSVRHNDFHAVLDEPPQGFRGFPSNDDAQASIGEDAWAEASACLERGGWGKAKRHKFFVVATWLQDASPRFSEMSFGRVLALVRGALSRRLLGDRDGFLVPYAQSTEHERKMNAGLGQPTRVGASEQHVKSWEELRRGLRALVGQQKENSLELERLKPMFRTLLKVELSETVFGHNSLSKLLGNPQLSDAFTLEMVHKNSYVVRMK